MSYRVLIGVGVLVLVGACGGGGEDETLGTDGGGAGMAATGVRWECACDFTGDPGVAPAVKEYTFCSASHGHALAKALLDANSSGDVNKRRYICTCCYTGEACESDLGEDCVLQTDAGLPLCAADSNAPPPMQCPLP